MRDVSLQRQDTPGSRLRSLHVRVWLRYQVLQALCVLALTTGSQQETVFMRKARPCCVESFGFIILVIWSLTCNAIR